MLYLQETDKKEEAKLAGEKYEPFVYINGDTRKQLLPRSRYLLFKSPDKWSESQKRRAKILFGQYPDIAKAYSLTHSLRMIFNRNTIKEAARLSLISKSAGKYKVVESIGSGKSDKDIEVFISEQKIAEDSRWDGLKGYITNTDLEADKLIAEYHGLWVVERFQNIKRFLGDASDVS